MAVVACFYMWWWHSSMIVYFRILGSRSRSDDWIRASSHSSSASIRCHVNHPWSESFKARTSCAPRPGRILLSPAGKGWAFVRSIWKSGENETSGLLGHQRSPSRWVQQIKVCAGQTHIFYPLYDSGLIIEQDTIILLDLNTWDIGSERFEVNSVLISLWTITAGKKERVGGKAKKKKKKDAPCCSGRPQVIFTYQHQPSALPFFLHSPAYLV